MKHSFLRAVAILAPLRSHARKLHLRRLNLAVSIAGGLTELHGRALDEHDVPRESFSEHRLSGQGTHGGHSSTPPTFFSLYGLLTDGIFHIQIARDGESSLRARVPTVGTQSMENFRGGITSRASGPYSCCCFTFPPNSAAWTCCADPGHDRQGVMVI
jgi:hypothetical protein